ncbi:MAG TPA: hypothetical protein HA227_04290 [Candidatus Diapherotrites archaeon]|uniref:DNA primase small subunit PriS n=1 Tax=Candidatus Iainarchaeum sp. TaxID=3101447 RepID=A0A7J4KUS3_9ARCH|nr:hypothetical protein [Candidatus Diapherotrites archaeon]
MIEEEFLARKFHYYYSKNFVKEPPNIERREFGFGEFGKKISQRHFAFKNLADFNNFLRDEVPFYASCSPAHYEFPSVPDMQKKHLLGSDLIWEFDSDDFKTPCAEEHTLWKCPKCGLGGKGRLQYCTACGERTVFDEWSCPECLNAVKKQTLQLVEWLQDDFGFGKGLSVNFSGSKGFHVHLRSQEIFSLPQSGRVELLNYLTGFDLNLEALGFLSETGGHYSSIPLNKAKGWQEKLLSKLFSFLQGADALQLHSFSNLREKEASKHLLESRESILQELKNGRLFKFGKKSKQFWQLLLEHFVEGQKLFIDRQTSIDLVKIVRVPETLHGGTGLLAKKIQLEGLKAFDALSETIVFSSNPVKVFAEKTPKFFLKGNWFGPFEQQEIELPEFAAVFLLARKSAKLKARGKGEKDEA